MESADRVLHLQGKTVIKIDLVPAGKSESLYVIPKYAIPFNMQKFRFLSHIFNFLMSEQKKYDM